MSTAKKTKQKKDAIMSLTSMPNAIYTAQQTYGLKSAVFLLQNCLLFNFVY